MATYHLRPVDQDPSPSPTSSSTPPGDHSPRYKTNVHRPTSPAAGRSRRPLSPSSLRDVDLTQSSDMQSRSRFPAPPTGHELMALFPAPAPEGGPEARGGPTSGFFQRQERAFFAQAGKEIIRVRVEVDLPAGAAEPEPSKGKSASSRSWSQMPGQPGPHQSPLQSSAPPPQLFPHSNSRPPQRGTVPVTPLFPLTSHPPPPPPQHPPNLHPPVLHQPSPGLRTPPQDHSQSAPPQSRPEYPHEDYDDDSWRKPIPYAERRRAGKHTRRVIVRT
ncbi:hypothetical protein D9756_008035 [Leucocoprinus leucothites]|uniref:Uncharacterized protein n=1 Tax=Leucocoprinus leucothites TaxID=201217 RepID=A0A8H5D451_9AGAR|nr:hypothetical protein D9756_008035 [Leucoagaricus leucothites]